MKTVQGCKRLASARNYSPITVGLGNYNPQLYRGICCPGCCHKRSQSCLRNGKREIVTAHACAPKMEFDRSRKTLESARKRLLTANWLGLAKTDLVFVSCRFQSHSCPGHRMTQHSILAQIEDALHMETGLRIRSSSSLSPNHRQLSCPERELLNDQLRRTLLQSEPYA